jgi:hypothetical protein
MILRRTNGRLARSETGTAKVHIMGSRYVFALTESGNTRVPFDAGVEALQDRGEQAIGKGADIR